MYNHINDHKLRSIKTSFWDAWDTACVGPTSSLALRLRLFGVHRHLGPTQRLQHHDANRSEARGALVRRHANRSVKTSRRQVRPIKGLASERCENRFSRMRSEGSRFTWGSGGEAVFAKFCVCVRNHRQPSATVCGDAVRLSTVASASGVVPKACQVDSFSPQLYWRLQRRCLCEWAVSPQLYWSLQRRCLCEWAVSPQLYWCLQRRCLCEWSVSPQL